MMAHATQLPPLLLSQGDPAGVGPEISLLAWQALHSLDSSFAVVADLRLMQQTAQRLDLPPPCRIDHPAQAHDCFAQGLPVLNEPLEQIPNAGAPDVAAAPQILRCLDRCVAAIQSGQARALITNPIAKSVLRAGGFAHPGHTEYLAALTLDSHDHTPAPRGPVMMLAVDSFRVALATIHMPLKDVPAALTPDRLARVIRVTHTALQQDFGISDPQIAVCGLNPHAGEGGMLGTEEQTVIQPVIVKLQAEGLRLTGPLPADTLFAPEIRAPYDAIIAMYHDQGLVPLKAFDFWRGVNITLGLPIVRTSPDHGTGFEIAGTGTARAESLIEAIRSADQLSRQRLVGTAA